MRKTEHVLTEYLVISSQMGDKHAFEQLIALWYPKLLRYAERVLNDPSQAQDTVQIVMETTCKSLSKLKDPGAFPKWVYQVLHYKCADNLRHQQTQKKVIDESEEVNELTHQLNTTELQLSRDTDKALQMLPSKFYEVLHLHYLEDLSTAEVASILGISLGTVKSRLFKARKLLKRTIVKADYE